MLPDLIDKLPKTVRRVAADGACDGLKCRKSLYERNIEDIIPPPINAYFKEEKEITNRNNRVTRQ